MSNKKDKKDKKNQKGGKTIAKLSTSDFETMMNDTIKYSAEKSIAPLIKNGMTREAAESHFKYNVANKILDKQGGNKKIKSNKKNDKQGGKKKTIKSTKKTEKKGGSKKTTKSNKKTDKKK